MNPRRRNRSRRTHTQPWNNRQAQTRNRRRNPRSGRKSRNRGSGKPLPGGSGGRGTGGTEEEEVAGTAYPGKGAAWATNGKRKPEGVEGSITVAEKEETGREDAEGNRRRGCETGGGKCGRTGTE